MRDHDARQRVLRERERRRGLGELGGYGT
jgi:hypothetical protein